MNSAALEKANSRLRVAEKAINELVGTMVYDQFIDNWYTFLTSFKGVYTVLEQGTKVSAQSRQWFGKKQRERREDPLLQYVYQARNDDEHGIGISTAYVEGNFMHDTPWSGVPREKIVFSGLQSPVYRLNLVEKQVTIEILPQMKLISVHGRGTGEVYNPPTIHLGIALTDTSPLAVGRLAIVYLESLVTFRRKNPVMT